MIWRECIPKANYSRSRQAEFATLLLVRNSERLWESKDDRGKLPILRASRSLYREISPELYRIHNILTSWFHHYYNWGKVNNHRERALVRLGNTCWHNELLQLDLRKFRRLRVDVKLLPPGDHQQSDSLNDLVEGVIIFAQEVRKQELMAEKENMTWRPDLEITIDYDLNE